MSRVDERAYNLIFNNCEHFKNWVLHGKGISQQAITIGAGIGLAGVRAYILGIATESTGLKKTGAVILITLAIIIIVAFAILMLQYKQDQEEN
jgi:hypothetical protein